MVYYISDLLCVPKGNQESATLFAVLSQSPKAPAGFGQSNYVSPGCCWSVSGIMER